MNLLQLDGALAIFGGVGGLIFIAYLAAMVYYARRNNQLLVERFHVLEVKLSRLEGFLDGNNKVYKVERSSVEKIGGLKL